MLLSNITDERLAAFQWGVVISVSLAAAVCDLHTRRIPNKLTFPLLLAGLIFAAWTGGLSALAGSAGGCVLLALPYVVLFVCARGGAGDAKLMGGIGAWLGLTQGTLVLFCVAAAGIVSAIAKAAIKRQAKIVLTSVFVSAYSFMLSLAGHKMKFAGTLADGEQPGSLDIPYGTVIFAGVVIGGAVTWCL